MAVKSGDAVVDLLQMRGVTNLVTYPSYEQIIDAAREDRVSVFVMDKPPAQYFLHQQGLHRRFKMSAPLYSGRFHRAGLQSDREATPGLPYEEIVNTAIGHKR